MRRAIRAVAVLIKLRLVEVDPIVYRWSLQCYDHGKRLAIRCLDNGAQGFAGPWARLVGRIAP